MEFFEGMEGAVERGLENRYVTDNGKRVSRAIGGGWRG